MHSHTRKLLMGLTLTAALAALGYWALGRGPDFQVSFERQVASAVEPARIEKAVHNLINWPDWHFNTRQVKAVDAGGQPYSAKMQTLLAGSLLEFEMEPPKKEWRRFVIKAVVTDYFPSKILAVRLLSESSGRLQRIFSNLQWTLEFEPHASGKGTLIRGRVSALTRSRRARIFARIAPRIVMNQVFYPDLEKLARIEFPKEPVGP
jgi:hypothetical protein